jgi:hypothetical protein
MKITKEQQLLFSLQYAEHIRQLIKTMKNDEQRLLKVMEDFDFTEGFDFKKFAKQAIQDHIKTYYDTEAALYITNQLIE